MPEHFGNLILILLRIGIYNPEEKAWNVYFNECITVIVEYARYGNLRDFLKLR